MEASCQFQASAALPPGKGQSLRPECSIPPEEVLTKTTTTAFLPSLHVRQKRKRSYAETRTVPRCQHSRTHPMVRQYGQLCDPDCRGCGSGNTQVVLG